jgi:ABC-type multidrug transport system permease subunit
MLSTGVSGTTASCEQVEFLNLSPPDNTTCYNFLQSYMDINQGYLQNPNATSDCTFCQISSTDTFLAAVQSNFDDAWRNFGLMWVYIAFNIAGAIFIYWIARVPKGSKNKGSS